MNKKPIEIVKSKTISLRIREEDYIYISNLCKEKEISMSELIRKAIYEIK